MMKQRVQIPIVAAESEKNNEDRETLMNRVEDKYFVNRKHLDLLTNELKTKLGFGDIDTDVRFNINRTFYLDNQDLDIFRDCVHGVKPRMKVRVRQYAPNGKEWESVAYLEFKVKTESGVTEKIRIRIFSEWLDDIARHGKLVPVTDQLINLNRDIPRDQLQDRIESINRTIARYNLRLQLVVLYGRRAYSNNQIRITIDDCLHYAEGKEIDQALVDSLRASPDWAEFTPDYKEFHSGDFLIVEVKHQEKVPDWIEKLLESVGARKVKFSKYCAAVASFLINGQAPEGVVAGQPLPNEPVAPVAIQRGVQSSLETPAGQPDSFLPDWLVMLDCEMTGVVPERDELLQVAMLKLKRDGHQYYATGEPLDIYLHTDKQPETDFQKKFLRSVYKKCNESKVCPEGAKELIHDWLGDLKGQVMPTGDCCPTDMAFLYAKNLIDRPDIQDDQQVPGTFHYEYFEANPIKACSRQKTGRKESTKDLAGYDEDNIHQADVDCHNQLIELNHYLDNLLGPARDQKTIKSHVIHSGLAVPYHTVLCELHDCCSEKDYGFYHTQSLIPKDSIFEQHPYQTDFPDGREQIPHVTVLYGLKNEEDFFPIRKYFADQEPIDFTIGKIMAFRNDDKPYDVLVLEIKSDDLAKHHWAIRNNFDTECSFPDYKSHMTLAYIRKGTCRDLEGHHPWAGQSYSCGKLKFSHKDDFKIDMDLRKPQMAMEPWVGMAAAEDVDLPKNLAPAVRPGELPPGAGEIEILRKFSRKALRADSFQDFQALLDEIVLSFELTEDYRASVAGVLNSLRIQEGYVAL